MCALKAPRLRSLYSSNFMTLANFNPSLTKVRATPHSELQFDITTTLFSWKAMAQRPCCRCKTLNQNPTKHEPPRKWCPAQSLWKILTDFNQISDGCRAFAFPINRSKQGKKMGWHFILGCFFFHVPASPLVLFLSWPQGDPNNAAALSAILKQREKHNTDVHTHARTAATAQMLQ